MFSGLRHDAFVGGDDEHGEVDAPDARQHVLDEALVTRDVDDLDRESVRLFEKRKAEIDRDAASLLFGQTVGVDTGQGFDERGFAVVDVSRGADDYCSGGRVPGLLRGWPAQGAKWLRLPSGFIKSAEWLRLYPGFTEYAEVLDSPRRTSARHPGLAAAAMAAASALTW